MAKIEYVYVGHLAEKHAFGLVFPRGKRVDVSGLSEDCLRWLENRDFQLASEVKTERVIKKKTTKGAEE